MDGISTVQETWCQCDAFEYSLYVVCYESEKDEKMSKFWLLIDFPVFFSKDMGEIRRDLEIS